MDPVMEEISSRHNPKLKQARAAVVSAEATHAQALRDEKRYGDLLKSNAASRQDCEKMATAVRTS
jgi:multidrug resistance efflux pump